MCTADFELQTRSFSDLRLTLKFRTLALQFVKKLLSFLSLLGNRLGWLDWATASSVFIYWYSKTSLFIKEMPSFA